MQEDRKLIIYDAVLLAVSLYLAILLRFNFSMPAEYMGFLKLSIVPVIVITLVFNKFFKLYSSIWKYASVEELVSVIYSVSLSNIIFVLYSYIISFKFLENRYYRFPFSVHIIFWILSVVILGGTRFLLRMFEQGSREQPAAGKKICRKSKKLLIIGAGDAAAMLVKEIKRHSNLNYDIKGLIDDDLSKKGKLISGIEVLGGRDDIIRVCSEKGIEEIIIAIPSVDMQRKKKIINICKETECKLKILPGIYEIVDGRVNISKLRDVNIEDLLGREEVKLNSDNINRYIKDKVILVTGGGGSIGSELCRQIAKFKPRELLILDIYENNVYDVQMELNYNHPELNKKVIIASIRDIDKMREVFRDFRPDVVFHAAAHKHVPLMEMNPGEAVKNNIIGTYNVLKCCSEFSVKKFVQISTDKAVNPTNIMGATKRFCEMMVQAFDEVSSTEYVAVRFGNVLGSNGSVIPLFKKQIAHGGPVTVTHPEINRFFMTIPEAAQLVIQAGAIANGGEIFVLDMGKPVKIADLARDLITLSGYKPDEEIKIEYTGLRPGEKLYEELLMDEIALTSTEHKKIFVEKPNKIDIKYIEDSIDEFRKVAHDGDREQIFKLMEQKVPTYTRKKNEKESA